MNTKNSIYQFFFFIFLFAINNLSFSQSNFKIYEFDKLRQTLIKVNSVESQKIQQWIHKSLTINYESICTPRLINYLSVIPDEIEIGMEQNLIEYKRKFYQKWSMLYDMKRIPGVHPFELGNGGCVKSRALDISFIGYFQNNYFFNVTIFCDENKLDTNKLILKIIKTKDKYLIDDVMSQKKHDYFIIN